MQKLKVYLSRTYLGDSLPHYKFTKKCGYIASSPEYSCIKRTLSELNIIGSEKTKFEDIILGPEEICTLLEEGVEVFIV